MSGGILQEILIYLATAVVFVPVAKKLGMGSVLGYLLGGIVIGPFCLGFVGAEGRDIMHFAEFGVVMMLFLIGLELDPAGFWRMRRMIAGTGVIQMGGTVVLCFGVLMAIGFTWQAALACGLALSMSSTAIVMQTLREKRPDQDSGRAAFLCPAALSGYLRHSDSGPHAALCSCAGLRRPTHDADQRPSRLGADPDPAGCRCGGLSWRALHRGASAAIHFTPRPAGTAYSGRPSDRDGHRRADDGGGVESRPGDLSGRRGAGRLAVPARAGKRHRTLQGHPPLGLFFIAVGASINFSLILANPWIVAALVAGVVGIKALVLHLTARLARMSIDQNAIFSTGLAQVGEFAFVLFAFMAQLGILTSRWTDVMMGVTAISMTVTPVMLLINERLILPRFGTKEAPEKRPADDITGEHPVIVAGFGHFGSTVGRFLRANGVNATILDNDSDRVELLRKMGFNVFYGDAGRLDILKAAGADHARVLIASVDSPEFNAELVEKIRHQFPNLTVMVRARNRMDAYRLIDAGVRNIYRETLDTSIRLGVDALVLLGFRRYSATRAGQNFMRYDEAAMPKMAAHRHDKEKYIFSSREEIAMQEELLANDREANPTLHDHAWDHED